MIEYLPHIAGFITLSAYFCKNQLMLRFLVIIGAAVYIIFYIVYGIDEFLASILWSTTFIAVNIVMIFLMMLDKTKFSMTIEERKLFSIFAIFTPGEFRKLLNTAEWIRNDDELKIIEEGQFINSLYFILDGEAEIKKDKQVFISGPQIFLGEMAFLNNEKATASVALKQKSTVLKWDANQLKKLFEKRPDIETSMGILFNQDLSKKLKLSRVG